MYELYKYIYILVSYDIYIIITYKDIYYVFVLTSIILFFIYLHIIYFCTIPKSHFYMFTIFHIFLCLFFLYKWLHIPLHYGYECNNVHNATIYLCYATSMSPQFTQFHSCWSENKNLWSNLVVCLEKFISLFRYINILFCLFSIYAFVCCALQPYACA